MSEASTETVAPPRPLPIKPGSQTSEFYAMVIAGMIAIAWVFGRFFSGQMVSIEELSLLIGVVTGPFTVSRTVLKGAAILRSN